MIPLVKISLPARQTLMPAIEKTLYSGHIAEGESVYKFEKMFAEKFSLPIAVSTSSGTAALHTSLVLAGVKEGDEVITTSMTAEPTNISILQVGATPVFADVDITSGNLDPDSIKQCITENTKAILIVHYAGNPARMAEISEISKETGIPIIEDCAHALGARYQNLGIGTFGDFAIFSLQAIKHMTTVDGGFLVIRDPSLTKKAKKFRWFGLEKGVPRTEIDIDTIGYKYNMHNIAATIGLIQLQDINTRVIDKHKRNGKYFDQEVSRIPGLSVATFDEQAESSYWLFTILSDDSDDVEQRLSEIGVSASKLHRPNHKHSIFKPYASELPNLEKYYNRMIHIPCGWWITGEDRERIINTLKKG